MKKLFAIITLTCVLLVASVMPCFAYIDSEGNPSNEGFIANPTYLKANNAYATTTNFRNIINLVDDAYTLGLFGGAWPIAIEMKGSGQLRVYCITPANNNGHPKRDDQAGWVEYTDGVWEFYTVKANVVSTQKCTTFLMMTDGSFDPESAWTSSTNLSGMIAYYDNGNWVKAWDQAGGATTVTSGTPIPEISTIAALYRAWLEVPPSTEDAYNSGYSAGMESGFLAGKAEGESTGYENGYDDGVLKGYQQGYEQGDREGYERGYDVGYFDGSPTTLNVPSIFDAMFDGVQSIFRSVDIEIFGISILGTLVAFLVIAIVTYAIKRLTK